MIPKRRELSEQDHVFLQVLTCQDRFNLKRS
jgi:hypothetical protein